MGSAEHGNLDSFKFLNGNEKLNYSGSKIKLTSMIRSTFKSENKSVCNGHKKEVGSVSLDLNLSTRESFVKERDETSDVSSFISSHGAKSADNSLSQKVTKHSNCYSPLTCSEWSSSTIHLTDSKNNTVCGSEIRDLHKNCGTSSISLTDGFKPSNISQLKPAKLLYESFLMKNLEEYSSSSDESTSDKMEGLTSRTTQELEYKKELNQEKVTKYRVAQNFSNSSVEMISVDPRDSVLEAGKNLNNDVMDLDLENLDWDEPFDLDGNSSSALSNPMESDCGVINIISPPRQTSVIKKKANEKSENNEVGKKHCWECPICLEQSSGQEIVTTLCGHDRCKQCLETYLSTTSESCSSCQTDIRGKSFVKLFNI